MWEHLGQQLMVSQNGEIDYEVAYVPVYFYGIKIQFSYELV